MLRVRFRRVRTLADLDEAISLAAGLPGRAGRLYSNTEASGGSASLHLMPFRYELTATLVYHAKPILDYFKRVDDATLMGIDLLMRTTAHGVRPVRGGGTVVACRRAASRVK